MCRRFVAIWFYHLLADWVVRRNPELKDTPFVLAAPERGRMVIKATNTAAQAKGIYTGMVVADCRAILPSLQVLEDIPGKAEQLLNALAGWCIRYTPVAGIDLPDGLILDVSGCTHLWGGEQRYMEDITKRLNAFGYNIKIALADTIGAAWAVARYGRSGSIIEPGRQAEALMPLHPAALRLEPGIVQRLEKLGLYKIETFIKLPASALRRRFGQSLITRLGQALGQEIEVVAPIQPPVPYQERLPCLEPIRTPAGIEIALQKLLETLCQRLQKEGKGLRKCVLKAYRIDNNLQQIHITTTRASGNVEHLFKLFELKIPTIEPALGFELFVLEAPVVEDMPATQDALWNTTTKYNKSIAELLDKLAGRLGPDTIHRYLPAEHYWPERSVQLSPSLDEQPGTAWRTDWPRPIHLLPVPEPIEVTVPMPDYPPMLFRYKGELHNVSRADGPERIEQEWWLQQGLYRDYYTIEDEKGARYWLFRAGDYKTTEPKWYIHGFFA